MNRGSNQLRRGEGASVRASMRPRFMNRGSLSHQETPAPGEGRFNEAPIHESGKCVRILTDSVTGLPLQ